MILYEKEADAIYDYITDNLEGAPFLTALAVLDSVKFKLIVENK